MGVAITDPFLMAALQVHPFLSEVYYFFCSLSDWKMIAERDFLNNSEFIGWV